MRFTYTLYKYELNRVARSCGCGNRATHQLVIFLPSGEKTPSRMKICEECYNQYVNGHPFTVDPKNNKKEEEESDAVNLFEQE